ncbi:MAG TPA: isocitrate lyase/phosphoenolpyruvate mutase family protein [Candidatus Polarisedimenticolaceae bacterium]|nr:isocitrate lyase/phosphoenolpyruvate mutase family protein [Candidatus Polarisedimenticolaceae bacterium]
MASAQAAAIARFRELHGSGCFVLPNPWDAGTARYLAELGFGALATTSAGAAFARGLPDDVTAICCETMLAHLREIVAAAPLPVNADFQSGYAEDAGGVGANVDRCLATGVAGLSIEDASGDGAVPLFPLPQAIERVRAAREAIDASGSPAVLTARCEAFLVGAADPLKVSLERLAAFAAAGADCLYAPGVLEPAAIAAIVKEVAPRPVNVLVSAPHPALSLSKLADLGVRRISVGSALARVAWGAFMRAAGGLAAGSFEGLADAASFEELNRLFGSTRTPRRA